MKLEDLKTGLQVRGIVPNQAITIVDVTWHSDAVEIIYKRADGRPDTELLYRANEASLELAQKRAYWNTATDSSLLRIVSEAYRIHLAHLFDPRLAVHTSLIEPLPHQITAVYGEMLTRQPLRFLLADDPGAGKTIMAGLLVKELMVRGDVRRCLICAPGSLTEQWQDELWTKFQLRFEILTRDKIEASHTGNPFQDYNRLIIRLDQVARDDDLKRSLQNSDWDLIICDEAHKMSASFFGNELKETKRYRLGKLLSSVARHFLLMTATPHNGKEEDFQLFMALLDQDRFEGRFRDGAHVEDTSDLMRRMVKEDLLKFDGRPLFPERRAYTVSYTLSPDEEDLYEIVTDYVREEFNRADQLQNGGRRGTVGFALTILQRRLASSPAAIYESLRRRRKKLEKRLQEAKRDKQLVEYLENGDRYDDEYLSDLEEFPDSEFEELEIELADSATAAQTIQELDAEIMTLRNLEAQARQVRNTGNDRKWEELATLMQSEMMFTQEGSRRKIVLFTEHRDTLDYLHQRLSTLLGNPSSIVTIHGGIRRSERLDVEDRFRNDPSVHVLLATDAAGEGINLQRAHLMVNYDLPWNPNRLEQRFGRIHRIGQEEVCHLWNLVAGQTREGQVYQRLLEKIQVEKGSLDGKVFDVLGKLFDDQPLRKLLVEAIRYGDQPEVRARLEQAVDNALDQERVRDLLEKHSLAQLSMDTSRIERVRAEMERAAAQRLQPYYIKAFFLSAFEMLGGHLDEREPGRYQINHVPAIIRDTARDMQGRGKVQRRYERISFDKALINIAGKPRAEFICPGHLFLDAIIELIAHRHNAVLQQGTILVDPHDPGDEPRALFYLEHALRDTSDDPRVISRAVQFVEINSDGQIRNAGSAPYLDYRVPTDNEQKRIRTLLSGNLPQQGAEQAARSYAISELAPRHLDEIRERRETLINKTLEAVLKRLTKEINYWDKRAIQLKDDARAGKRNAKINWQRAQQRADELAERLESRKRELEAQRQIAAAPPVIVGRALIIPIGMLLDEKSADLTYRKVTEQVAMRAVMEAEIAAGYTPKDVSAENWGWDIESYDGEHLRFLEVKGVRVGSETVTVTYNEIMGGLNTKDQFALVIVEVDGATASDPCYIWNPFDKEPESITFSIDDLLTDD